MKMRELLAMVGHPDRRSAALDRRVLLAQLSRLDFDAIGPVIRAGLDCAPSANSANENGEAIVYIAAPLSMLTSAAVPSTSAPSQSPVRRWCYHFAGWTFAANGQSLVAPGGGVRHMRPAERALLLAFVEQPWQTLLRPALAARIRSPNRPAPSDRAIDTYVCRLRAHFRQAGGHEVIASVHSVGYRFDSDVMRV